ncbi:hypothetical protein SK128_010468 [Halocaridina rubra]|uniref:TGF-beta family profile domain-containing protein n=1 Tax=Halocaridina rubra TaxID=373956 RepID=A0AAN8X9Y6_HALRR
MSRSVSGTLSDVIGFTPLYPFSIKDYNCVSLRMTLISRHPRHSQSQGTIIAQNAMSTSKTSGWITVDLSEAVKSWVSDGLTEVPVDISCPTCGGRKSHVSLVPDQKPFVIITMQPPKIRQQRSTVECSSSTVGGCCRASMNVTIAQMGWEDWIFQPTSFDFYYCRGHCNPSTSGHSSDTSNYIDMLNRLIRQQPRGSARQAALMPCCSPTSYVPIDIMYIKNSTLHIERINDLIVESCGCIG